MSFWLKCSVVLVLLLAGLGRSQAHGINGHINVTHWMTGEADVNRVWREPGCRNAMVFGAAFPDTGYGVNHEYGELTHWAPFLDAMIQYLQSVPSQDDSAQRLLTRCFVVGVAAHGLQDEIFDTFFLEQVATHDQVDQDIVDPGLDAIMVVDGIASVKPEIYVPKADVIAVLNEFFAVDVDEALLSEAARRVKLAVIDHFAPIATEYAASHRSDLRWASEHYLNDSVVGSLASEIRPTGAYAASVWSRLHGGSLRVDIVSSFEGNSWVSSEAEGMRVYGLVLSRAVRVGSIHGGIAARRKGAQDIEYLNVVPGRWTRSDDQYTRVLRVEVPKERTLKAYELSAPEEWVWIDDGPSVGVWHSLTSPPEVSPVNPVPLRVGEGCAINRAKTMLSELIFGLFVLSLSVRRLQP